MAKSYIALGSNVGDAKANVLAALRELSEVGQLEACSSLYETKPWGKTDQADFVNAVAQVETSLTPTELLNKLLEIERAMGRERVEKWGPRIIDLDILTYDDLTVAEPNLQIPHPHMAERSFVLIPLVEIDPSYKPLLDKLNQSYAFEATVLEPIIY